MEDTWELWGLGWPVNLSLHQQGKLLLGPCPEFLLKGKQGSPILM